MSSPLEPAPRLAPDPQAEPPSIDDALALAVGCAMWAHPGWVGHLFPPDTASGHELRVYGTWCTAVEGNTTFYAVPPPSTVARWADDAPDGFQFCFKLPRTITHDRRLRNVGDEVATFLAAVEPLADHLGPVQIQLPPSFGPADLGALIALLDGLPRSHRWAVEARHPDFFVGGSHERHLDDALIERGVDRVVLDTRSLFDAAPMSDAEHEAWNQKPRLPVRPMATGPSPIVRLIGQTDRPAALRRWQGWVEKLADWLVAGRRPIVFTHTPDNLDAPLLARELHGLVAAELESRGRTLAPLPRPRTAGRQLDLWTDRP